jgi:hypothetical protein
MRIAHVPGAHEPLLWVPDIVAGAVSSSLHGDSRYVTTLGPVLDLVTFEEDL